jgi:hypothetical protein
MQLDEGILRSSVDPNEEIEFPFLRSNFGNVDMEKADWIRLELFRRLFVTFNIRQSANAMTVQTAMQRRPRQMLDRRLQRVKTIVERQKRMPAKGDDDRFFFHRKNRGFRLPGSG